MSKETIDLLKSLNNELESYNTENALKVVEKLIEIETAEIRKAQEKKHCEFSKKSDFSQKKRTAALKKMIKKTDQFLGQGYHPSRIGYCFTNSYSAYFLKDSNGFDPVGKEKSRDVDFLLNDCSERRSTVLNKNDIAVYTEIQTAKLKASGSNADLIPYKVDFGGLVININANMLLNAMEIMGTKTIYSKGNHWLDTCYMENEAGEVAVLMPIRINNNI